MAVESASGRTPTVVDRGFQFAYVCAYQLMKTYWKLSHPTTHGTLVTIWNRGEVLLVRNSYVRYYSAPGGYVRDGETSRAAALRELREETGIVARPEQIELALDETHEWEGKTDHVEIFSLDVEERPRVQVDNREVVEATWFPKERALALDLFPPLRQVIRSRG